MRNVLGGFVALCLVGCGGQLQTSSDRSDPASRGKFDLSGIQWSASGPTLAGKALHYTRTQYQNAVGATDLANGIELSVDLWLKLDQSGLPELAHALTTLADGTLHQETIQTKTQTSLTLGPSYAEPGTTTFQRAASEAQLAMLLPQFADESKLGALGYTMTTEAWSGPSPTTAPIDAAAIQHLASAKTVHTWKLSEEGETGSSSRLVACGADGRVVATATSRTDKTGVIQFDGWTKIGALDVYESNSVPDSVFALSAGAQALPAAAPGTMEMFERAASTLPTATPAAPQDRDPACHGSDNGCIYTGWSCKRADWNVQGGRMRGEGCVQYTNCTNSRDICSLTWMIGGQTWVPQSEEIDTWVNGWDTCDGSNWTEEMSTWAAYFNTTYGTALRAVHTYLDCQGGSHSYAVEHRHRRRVTSSSPWEDHRIWQNY